MTQKVAWNAPQQNLVKEIDRFNTPRKLIVSDELINRSNREVETELPKTPKKGIIERVSGWLKETI